MCPLKNRVAVRTFSASQVSIDTLRRIPPLSNRPHNQRRTAMRVTRSENSGHSRMMGLMRGDIASTVQLERKIIQQPALHRTSETHRQQYEIRLHLELSTRNLCVARTPIWHQLSLQSHGVNLFHFSILAGERSSRNTPFPIASLFMRM